MAKRQKNKPSHTANGNSNANSNCYDDNNDDGAAYKCSKATDGSEAGLERRRSSALAPTKLAAAETEAARKKQVPAPLLERIRAFCLYKLLLPFLLGLLLALYCKHCLQPFGGDQPPRGDAGPRRAGSGGPQRHPSHAHLARPEPLMSYVQFAGRYPRKHYLGRPPKYTERAHRSLLFNLDLIHTASHNLAYLCRQVSYSLRQSPFKADRTLAEQADFLGQLDEFNLTQIMSNSENRRRLHRLRLKQRRHHQYSHDEDDVGDDYDYLGNDDDADHDSPLDPGADGAEPAIITLSQ